MFFNRQAASTITEPDPCRRRIISERSIQQHQGNRIDPEQGMASNLLRMPVLRRPTYRLAGAAAQFCCRRQGSPRDYGFVSMPRSVVVCQADVHWLTALWKSVAGTGQRFSLCRNHIDRMPRRFLRRTVIWRRTAKSFSGQRVKRLRRLLPRFIVQVIEVGLLRGFLVGNFAMVLGKIQVH